MSDVSALYVGTVTHRRLQPLRHRLSYRVFSLLLDLDELGALERRLRCFSVNRWNLFSLHERDHGSGTSQPGGLRAYVEGQLHAAGLPSPSAIRLLSMPRILGHAFNPLSVYFCHHADGRLQAMLYEVNNTFGQRHSYLIEVTPQQSRRKVVTHQCDKAMYVSPFLGMNLQYAFRIRPPGGTGRPPGSDPGKDNGSDIGRDIGIGITVSDRLVPVLTAALNARRRELTDAALLATFFTHPLLTLKVVAGIHWEALRLWLKGARLQPRPPAPTAPPACTAGVTIVKAGTS